MDTFGIKLIKWQKRSGRRDLPWQIDQSPYKVWISEIMLQQTQVKTVIPYFERFIEKFPNLSSLANSDLDEVLALWAGLGYYARARNLHKTAKIIKEKYCLKIPDTQDELVSLPGIGRSTAGAILSLGSNKRAAILDGNVKRVLTRYKDIHEDITKTKTLNSLWIISEELLPKRRYSIYNQSLMDLGATICKKTKPLCELCPVSDNCKAKINKTFHLIPNKGKKRKKSTKKVFWLLPYTDSGYFYLKKRPSEGIWGGLWTFLENQNLEKIIENNSKLRMVETSLLKHSSIRHSFSHFKLEVELYLIKSKEPVNKNGWKKIEEINDLGMPRPIINTLNSLQKNGKINFM